MIEAGQRIPTVDLFVLGDNGPEKVSSDALFGGKRVALFWMPGAFTRTCSARHLPGYLEHLYALKAAGVDDVMCLSANDVFVLTAWADMHDANGKVSMISNGCLSFTRAARLGLISSRLVRNRERVTVCEMAQGRWLSEFLVLLGGRQVPCVSPRSITWPGHDASAARLLSDSVTLRLPSESLSANAA
jgi:peroxiredoxin